MMWVIHTKTVGADLSCTWPIDRPCVDVLVPGLFSESSSIKQQPLLKQTATTQAQVTPAQSNNQVYISDQANVLNVSQIQSEASNLPDPISIYTVNTFTGTSTDFDQHTRSDITSTNMIVLAIGTDQDALYRLMHLLIEQACEYAFQAMNIATQIKSQISLQRHLTLRDDLEPWKETQYVRDLDKHIVSLLPTGRRQERV